MFRNRTPIRHFGFNGHDLASDLFFAGAGSPLGSSPRWAVRVAVEGSQWARPDADGARGLLWRAIRYAQDSGWCPLDSAIGRGSGAGGGLESSSQVHRARGAGLRDVVGQTHLTEQRATPADLPGVRSAGTPAGEVVDAPPHLLLMGAREGRAGQGRGSADGTRQSRHWTCTRRWSMARSARRPTSDPNCSQLFTNRKRRAS